MKPEVDHDAMRITQQFRTRDALVCILRGANGGLTLRITGQAEGDGPATQWRIEASAGSSPDAVVVTEVGITRAEALRAVSLSWDKKRVAGNLPSFNWESVTGAMAAVRAI